MSRHKKTRHEDICKDLYPDCPCLSCAKDDSSFCCLKDEEGHVPKLCEAVTCPYYEPEEARDMKPILFKTEMVRAILEGRKTVTRRPVKDYALEHLQVDVDGSVIGVYQQDEGSVFPAVSFAPYRPGDICYIPEPWKYARAVGAEYAVIDFKDGEDTLIKFDSLERAKKWRKYLDKPRAHWQSPYFMPREAARMFLRVTDVRVERILDMGQAEARAEGFLTWGDFVRSWDRLIRPKDRGLYGWAANPWVWVIEFERITMEEAKGHEHT